MCPHQPSCPCVGAPDQQAARVVVDHHEQGWTLLCNGVIVFDDTGSLLPDRRQVAPRRWADSTQHHVRLCPDEPQGLQPCG